MLANFLNTPIWLITLKQREWVGRSASCLMQPVRFVRCSATTGSTQMMVHGAILSSTRAETLQEPWLPLPPRSPVTDPSLLCHECHRYDWVWLLYKVQSRQQPCFTFVCDQLCVKLKRIDCSASPVQHIVSIFNLLSLSKLQIFKYCVHINDVSAMLLLKF